MNHRTLLLIILISFGVNIMQTTSSSSYYRGFMVKTMINKVSKKSKERQEVEKICQSKIFNISSEQTFVTESCVRPVKYYTPTQQVIRTVAVFAIYIIFIGAFCNMNSRDREDASDFICGMIVADFVDSLFDD
tara:strand:+ start:97 stop:495 length:399 start_codon:yes stop_codon:yes gene_type:complete